MGDLTLPRRSFGVLTELKQIPVVRKTRPPGVRLEGGLWATGWAQEVSAEEGRTVTTVGVVRSMGPAEVMITRSSYWLPVRVFSLFDIVISREDRSPLTPARISTCGCRCRLSWEWLEDDVVFLPVMAWLGGTLHALHGKPRACSADTRTWPANFVTRVNDTSVSRDGAALRGQWCV